MADQEQQKKRHLKNPETFRERAVKAADAKSKPKVTRASKLKRPLKPIAGGFRKLKKVQALKPVFGAFKVIGRIIFPKYFRTSLEELKKVSWPSFKESRKLTYAVLIFAIVFGASVAIVDWGLSKVFRHLLLK